GRRCPPLAGAGRCRTPNATPSPLWGGLGMWRFAPERGSPLACLLREPSRHLGQGHRAKRMVGMRIGVMMMVAMAMAMVVVMMVVVPVRLVRMDRGPGQAMGAAEGLVAAGAVAVAAAGAVLEPAADAL